MDIKVKDVFTAAVLYMYLPVSLFILGWIRLSVAVPVLLVLCFCIFSGLGQLRLTETRTYFVDKKILLLGTGILLFLCWHSGIGAFTGQAGDWYKHNAVMHDLIERPWPVLYHTDYGSSMLSYYIGQYLIPAAIGKIAGSFRAAEFTQYVLAVTGLLIIWLLLIPLCRLSTKKSQVFGLLLLFFFGGMLALGQTIAGTLYPENFPFGSYDWMNPDTVRIQYTSNWSLLKWVPGQAIVPWISASLLLLNLKKLECYVLMGLSVIMYSGFAMIGILFMMGSFALYYLVRSKGKDIKKLFSLTNLLLSIFIGSICILYFAGNLTGEKPENLNFRILDYGQKKSFYFIFIFFMFGGYCLLIFKEFKKNIVYWTTVTALCLYPLFSMGLYNDFTMRASIPAAFTLMVLLLSFITNTANAAPPNTKIERIPEHTYLSERKAILITLLLIGMIYPILSVRESIVKNTPGEIMRSDSYMSLEQFANPSDPEIPEDF